MSDAFFPSNLPGLKWDVSRKPTFKTEVYEALSGAERRFAHRQSPKRMISFSYEFLRNDRGRAQQELESLVGFFEARKGAYDSFLFYDAFQGDVSNQQFGIGDGTATDFQLTRTFGGLSQVVHNPESTLVIGRVFFPSAGAGAPFWPQPDGIWPLADEYEPPSGGWTLLPNGIVHFTTAPPAGKKLLWSGKYYHRARFADDTLDHREFLYRLFNAQKVELVTSLQNIL